MMKRGIFLFFVCIGNVWYNSYESEFHTIFQVLELFYGV